MESLIIPTSGSGKLRNQSVILSYEIAELRVSSNDSPFEVVWNFAFENKNIFFLVTGDHCQDSKKRKLKDHPSANLHTHTQTHSCLKHNHTAILAACSFPGRKPP